MDQEPEFYVSPEDLEAQMTADERVETLEPLGVIRNNTHEVVLDRHGVYGLPRNLLVENIIDVYKQEVSNNSNATCPRPLPPPSAQLTCSDHEGEKVNIYCLTCQRPTCSLCKVFGAHHACQVAPLTDIWHQQKDELSEAVSSLAAVNNKVQTLINELEETCRNVEENCKTQKQSVCETFSRVFSILEERQKAMMQRISTEQEEKTGHAQELMRCYGDSVEANSKLVERAVSCMEEPDMAAFVQNSKELITEVIAASSSCPAEALKPGCESLSHYRFDFSRQEKALKSIDFLKVVEEVPEEAEVEPEPEEPKEDSVQNVEPEQHQETSAQNLDPGVEAIPELVSPPEELTAVTLPCEALSDADDWTTQSATEDQQDTQDEEEMIKEEMAAGLYPGWHPPGSWRRVSPVPADISPKVLDAEQTLCPEAGIQAEAEGAVQVVSEPQIQPRSGDPGSLETPQAQKPEQSMSNPNQPSPGPQQLLLSTELHTQQHLPLPHESERKSLSLFQSPPQTVPVEQGSALTPVPHLLLTGQAAGDAGISEEETEEEDMQGWVCLPGAVDQSFSLAHDSPSLHPAETSERGSSEMGEDEFELTDGGAEDAEETEQHDEDPLDLKCASDLRERELETMNEGLEEGNIRCDERKEKMGCVHMREDGSEQKHVSLDTGHPGVERKTSWMQGAGNTGSEEKKEDNGENSEQPQDLYGKMETSVHETEEKITSSVSLQVSCHSALLPVGLPGHPAEGLGLHRLLHLHITPAGDTSTLTAAQFSWRLRQRVLLGPVLLPPPLPRLSPSVRFLVDPVSASPG
ncbi:hypothetical protein FQN60_009090 [Etheostoma spectabile]|uniref:RING-type E3 ubiquitin transferase n=1 Tax=Etheostoma spectabile TaxID=54343 RepID=A0A5J5CPJ8_9PERO|nr:hypothetical protein FQN60_009090 [Etheostoma spectabile]